MTTEEFKKKLEELIDSPRMVKRLMSLAKNARKDTENGIEHAILITTVSVQGYERSEKKSAR